MRRTAASGLTALALALASLPAHADEAPGGADKRTADSPEQRADTHLRRGIEFYAEKQYELAIVEFRAGFALDPRPELLFALAQAERLSGDCPTAVVYYERFLETGPDPAQAEAARANLERCRRALQSGPEGRALAGADAELEQAEQAGESERAPELTPSAASPEPALSRPWYRDTVGVALLGGGAVALGVATWGWRATASAQHDADRAATYLDYVDHMDRARRNRTIGWVSAGIGTVLVGGAAIRYATRGPAEQPAQRSVVVVPVEGGSVIGLSGRF